MKKDPKKAMLLSLFPGLGFLYMEDIKSFFIFCIIPFLPIVLKGSAGTMAYICSGIIYVLSIYLCYTHAIDSLKNTNNYKKDPYYVLCLSIIVDGWGQYYLGYKTEGILMCAFGFTSCLIGWFAVIKIYGTNAMLMNYSGVAFMITNFMIVWTIASIFVKILSMIDAFYSTYHLYVAKKDY